MENKASFFQQYRIQILFGTFLSLFMAVVWIFTLTGSEFLLLLPLVAMVAYVALNNFKHFWYLSAFFMPLSITFHNLGGIGLTFPTDLFAIVLIGILLFKMASERKMILTFLHHPISWVLIANWFVLLLTAIASELPVVSFKWLAAYTWMVGAYFFVPVLFFRDQQSTFSFFKAVGCAFILALTTIFAFYITSGRNPFGLRFNPGPFFLDHTVFGAFTATWLPLLLLISFKATLKKRERLFFWVATLFFMAGLYFSYSRGAWMSCLVGIGLMGLFMLGATVRKLIIPGLVLSVIVGGYLYIAAPSNSSVNAAVSRKDLSSHIASITNFKTDDSNAERINRWMCALEMFWKDPWTGNGPGTYAMEYVHYQKARFSTPISTKHGDNGTAHNELLLAMAENGILGLIVVAAMVLLPIYFGIRGFHLSHRKNTRLLYLGVTFALVVYDIHALVNNFLDQDKIAVTYYSFLAIIVAMDVYLLPQEHRENQGLEVESA